NLNTGAAEGCKVEPDAAPAAGGGGCGTAAATACAASKSLSALLKNTLLRGSMGSAISSVSSSVGTWSLWHSVVMTKG
ncbi:hypothetical protein A2U01_0060892, partial [Trifolium medium]|nr:hypothetical protein [Trifolium medium]